MTIPSRKLVLASSNRGKCRELAAMLAPHSLEVIPQDRFAVPDVQETGVTFVENALIKARNAAAHAGLPAIADDSGLMVDALAGAPGIRSARYAGEPTNDEANNAKLLDALGDTPQAQRTARFQCVLVYLAEPADPMPLIACGTWAGRIARSPRGGSGFGYDPLFYVPSHACTAAELAAATKNAISHRAQALQRLAAMLGECP